MREFIKKIKSAKEINDSVTLDLFQRVKCRIKAVTDSGESIGIFMKRGTLLKNDDLIQFGTFTSSIALTLLILSFIFSFIFLFLFIKWVQRFSFSVFAIYRVLFGLIILGYFYI